MAKCRKPGCPAQSDGVSPYCAAHKGTPNIVLPVTPMRVQVLEQLEWDRMEAEMQTRARSTSAPPPRALLAGLPPPAPPPRRPAQPLSLEDYNQQKNRERSRVTYAALLESNRTDAQLLAPLIEAFYEIKFAPTFQGYMDEEIGWLNLNS